MLKNKIHNSVILDKLDKKPLLPLFYNDDVQTCKKLIDVIISTKLEVIEFTNRGSNAINIFRELAKYIEDQKSIDLGIGSVKNIEEAKEFIGLGAKFIVSPFLDEDVGKICVDNQITWVPGCGTLTEIIRAERAGAKLIKLFPGSVYGPEFISSVLGPCPWLKIMPTGGVTTELKNIEKWIKSGAFCLGMGSNLFPSNLLNSNDMTDLQKHILNVIEKIESIL